MNEIIHNNENIRTPEDVDMEKSLNFIIAHCDECGKKLDEKYHECLETVKNDATFKNIVDGVFKNVVNHPIDRDDTNVLKLDYAAKNNLNQLPTDGQLRTFVKNDMLMAQNTLQFSAKKTPDTVIEDDPLEQISDRIKEKLTPEQIKDFIENLQNMNNDQKNIISMCTDDELYNISLLLWKNVEDVDKIRPIQIMKIAHCITEAGLSPEEIKTIRLVFNNPTGSVAYVNWKIDLKKSNLTFIASWSALNQIGNINIEQIKMLSRLEKWDIQKLYWLHEKQISRITSKSQIEKISLPIELKYPAYNNKKIQKNLRANLTADTANKMLLNGVSPYELNMVNVLDKTLLSNEASENINERDAILTIIDTIKSKLDNFLNNESINNLEKNHSMLLKSFIDNLWIKDTLQKLSLDRRLLVIQQIVCLVNRVKNAKEYVKNLENIGPDWEDKWNALYNILYAHKGEIMRNISNNKEFDDERKNKNIELEQEGSWMIFYLSSKLYEEFANNETEGGIHMRWWWIPTEIDGTLCIIKKAKDKSIQEERKQEKRKDHELQHTMNYFFMEKEDNQEKGSIKDEILAYLLSDRSLSKIGETLIDEPYKYNADIVNSTIEKLQNYPDIKDKINLLMITKIDEWEDVLKEDSWT